MKTRHLSLRMALAMLLLPLPARADVINLPPDGYEETEEFGAMQFATVYLTPGGIPYAPSLGPAYGVTRRAIRWIPKDIPVTIEIGRDARGTFLFLSSLLTARDGRSRCWDEQTVPPAALATKAGLWRLLSDRLAAWTATCAIASTFGARAIIAEFAMARHDVDQAFARFDRTRRTRYIKTEDEADGREFGMPSFLPGTISQALLDAISDTCETRRSTLSLGKDGMIAVGGLNRGQSQTSDQAAAEMCVLQATDYLPGGRAAERLRRGQ
jgi:hypothetical protein